MIEMLKEIFQVFGNTDSPHFSARANYDLLSVCDCLIEYRDNVKLIVHANVLRDHLLCVSNKITSVSPQIQSSCSMIGEGILFTHLGDNSIFVQFGIGPFWMTMTVKG